MSIIKKVKAAVQKSGPRLPLAGSLKFRCFAEDIRGVVPLLSSPNSAAASARYGVEAVSSVGDDAILVARSARYQRYVMTGLNPPSGCCGVAVLEVRLAASKREPACVETVFVMPWARRQGVATRLLEQAIADFPKLAVDGHLTAEGAAFFGYKPKQAPAQLQASAAFQETWIKG